MALKGDRVINSIDIAWFMDEVAERGGVVSQSTAGSGAALDQAQNLATYAANGSGTRPLGVLVQDMVNVDLTKYKLNQHRDEVQQGGKVVVCDRGWFRTNFGEGTISTGPAYLGHSGRVTSTFVNAVASPRVGSIEATADEDGYFKFKIQTPMNLGL